MSNIPGTSVEEKMRALRTRFIGQLRERLDRLKQLRKQSSENRLGEAERSEIKFLAHKCSGSGSTFGFPTISQAGRALEEVLINRPNIPSTQLLPYLDTLISECKDALKQAMH